MTLFYAHGACMHAAADAVTDDRSREQSRMITFIHLQVVDKQSKREYQI